jgi:GT2 family glycosyltransferase
MISVVIVNWNSGPLLERCVLSLVKHAADVEIVVVDNASFDSSLNFAARSQVPIAILRNEENLGFAAGSNLGWRRSSGEQILFLNPDTECRTGSVSALAQTMIQDRSISAVGGKLVGPSGEHQAGFNVCALPTFGSVAAELLLLEELWPRNPWTRHYRMSEWDHSSRREVEQPAAACLLVQRDVLERLNGFDENFRPAWFEDVDLCHRIHDDGGRILFEPAAEFQHQGGSSLKHLAREEFLRYFHTNQIRYFYKHHGEDAALRVQRLVIGGMYLRAALSRIHPLIAGTTRSRSARVFWLTARHFQKLTIDH